MAAGRGAEDTAMAGLSAEDSEALLFDDVPSPAPSPRGAWRRLVASAVLVVAAVVAVLAMAAKGGLRAPAGIDTRGIAQKEQHDITKVYDNGKTNCFYATMDESPVCYHCFPGEALVEMEGRGKTPISGLRAGEFVRVSEGDFEPVLSFIHAGGVGRRSIHVKLLTDGPESLRASLNHLVFTAGVTGGPPVAVAAGSVRPGDELMLPSGRARVLAALREEAVLGMFAPVTPSGQLVVDGVVVSAYATVHAVTLPHGAMHASFFPVRVYHKMGLESLLAPLWQHTCGVERGRTHYLSWVCGGDGRKLPGGTDELSAWASLLHETLKVDRLLARALDK